VLTPWLYATIVRAKDHLEDFVVLDIIETA
jgi:hypothetical protein